MHMALLLLPSMGSPIGRAEQDPGSQGPLPSFSMSRRQALRGLISLPIDDNITFFYIFLVFSLQGYEEKVMVS